jgi:hypothetical protein
MTLYELALLGIPDPVQVEAITSEVSKLIEPFGIAIGREVGLTVAPAAFRPSPRHASAAIFIGGESAFEGGLAELIRQSVPIIPVASAQNRFAAEIPTILRPMNGLAYREATPNRIATALLECAGLLPRQRRVFVSYRRDESRAAALQLFDALSVRLFDVFLDTHGIPPAEDFQTLLWHRLCDSDVLLMIDTPRYFDSRWTQAEFGRALAKGIAVLRIGWPGGTVSPRAAMATTAGGVDLVSADVDAHTGLISSDAIEKVCHELESLRSQSIAVRHLNLVGQLRVALERIGGTVQGVGLHKGIHIQTPCGQSVVVYAIVGAPTSVTLHDAATHAAPGQSAVLYDHVGVHKRHLVHLEWLSECIPSVRLVRASDAAWDFAAWAVA